MELRRNAKVDLLRGLPLFSECTKRELEEVASIADEMDVPAGKALTEQGKKGREFFVLVEGAATVDRGGRRLNVLRAGDFFGEISLLAGVPRTATVTTTADSRVLVITQRAFQQLLQDVPSMQTKVLQALAKRVASTYA
jgi:CRP-like cAMP-binding protein